MQKVVPDGIQLWRRFFVFFLFAFVQEREDPNSTKRGSSSARQRNTIKMAFHSRANGGPTLIAGFLALWFFRGSGPVLIRNQIFCNFSGGGSGPSPSSLLINAWLISFKMRENHINIWTCTILTIWICTWEFGTYIIYQQRFVPSSLAHTKYGCTGGSRGGHQSLWKTEPAFNVGPSLACQSNSI